MELILLDKYLIRTDEWNYILQPCLKGKDAVVIINDDKRDYSNFGRKVFPSSFSQCLRWIKDYEIKKSDVTTVEELKSLIDEIDKKIESVRRKFF